MLNLNKHEPDPIRKAGAEAVWPAVWQDVRQISTVYPVSEQVIADMADRDRIGWERYNGPLVVHDGRNTLVDLYQELLDAIVYTKKTLMEGRGDGHALAEIYTGLIEQACAVRWMIHQQLGA